jgi:hypothetical protein
MKANIVSPLRECFAEVDRRVKNLSGQLLERSAEMERSRAK